MLNKKVVILAVVLFMVFIFPYFVVTSANVNQRGFKEVYFKKSIMGQYEYKFEFELPGRNYREVSLLFDSLSDDEVNILYSTEMPKARVLEGGRISLKIGCRVGQGIDESFSMRSPRLEANRTRIRQVLLGQWKKSDCSGVVYIYSEEMTEALFNKMRVVVDQGDMIFGWDLRGNYIYQILYGLYYFSLLTVGSIGEIYFKIRPKYFGL